MFSFFGHKKKDKSPPNESQDNNPPIPGPEDDFVVVNKRPDAPYPMNPPGGVSLYPPILPQGPSGANVGAPKKEVHFLQGVPFSLHKDFNSNRNDIMAMQLSEIMAYCSRRLNNNSSDYEFATEKSVLREES